MNRAQRIQITIHLAIIMFSNIDPLIQTIQKIELNRVWKGDFISNDFFS